MIRRPALAALVALLALGGGLGGCGKKGNPVPPGAAPRGEAGTTAPAPAPAPFDEAPEDPVEPRT